MQYIPNDPVPGSFSESLNRGLQQIVQMKMQKLQQRHEAKDTAKAFQTLGLDPDKAQAFAALPQHMQQQFISSGLLSSLQAAPQEIQQGGPQSALEQSVMGSQQQQQQPEMNRMFQQQESPTMNPNSIIQRALSGGMTPQQQQEMAAPVAKTPRPAPKPVQRAQQNPENTDQLPQKPLTSRQQLLLTSKEKADALKEAKSQRDALKEERIEQHRINKEVGPAYKEIVKEYKGALDDDRRLGRMEELINRGNLSRPRWHALLNTLEHGIFGLGANLHSFESGDSQEFDKLSKEFLKNAKNIFGARITDNDVKAFLKMVPDLSQNTEGRQAIIHNMKVYNQGIKIRKQASDQVLKENGGKLPYDFEARVEELAAPQLDALAKSFATEERFKEKPKEEKFSLLGLGAPELINPLDLIFGK